MKRFNEWLNMMSRLHPFYVALGGLRGMQFREEDGKVVGSVQPLHEAEGACPNRVHPLSWMSFLKELSERDPVDRLESWAICGLMAGGVKAFCPTAEEYAALGRVDINVTWGDYRQPFDTMAVVVPDDFYPQDVSIDIGRPVVSIIRIDRVARLCVHVLVGTGTCYITGRYPWRDGSTESMDGHFRRLESRQEGRTTNDEETASQVAKRAAFNACLMLTHCGSKRVGYANPEYAAKLETSLKKKKLPDNIREANRTALKLIPDVYAFDQSVRLFDTESSPHVTDGGCASYEVKPHWRRGHWRNQGVGAGRAERKMIFVRPVMVNAHKFHGDQFDTRATYTTGSTA